jgi:hypothetical protein
MKVAPNLMQWREEFETYHRKDGLIVKKNDDVMSATRIGVMPICSAKPAQAVTIGVASVCRERAVSMNVRMEESMADNKPMTPEQRELLEAYRRDEEKQRKREKRRRGSGPARDADPDPSGELRFWVETGEALLAIVEMKPAGPNSLN